MASSDHKNTISEIKSDLERLEKNIKTITNGKATIDLSQVINELHQHIENDHPTKTVMNNDSTTNLQQLLNESVEENPVMTINFDYKGTSYTFEGRRMSKPTGIKYQRFLVNIFMITNAGLDYDFADILTNRPDIAQLMLMSWMKASGNFSEFPGGYPLSEALFTGISERLAHQIKLESDAHRNQQYVDIGSVNPRRRNNKRRKKSTQGFTKTNQNEY